MERDDHEPVFTSAEVIYRLRHLGIARINAYGLESLGLAPTGRGEVLIGNLLAKGYIRCLPTSEAAVTGLQNPYDVVEDDGSVAQQADRIKKYHSLRTDNQLVSEHDTKTEEEVMVSKEMSLAVRQLLPNLVWSLLAEFGAGIYMGFLGTKLVGSDRCVSPEVASSTLDELLRCGFVIRVSDTLICFTDKAKTVAPTESRLFDSPVDHKTVHQVYGGADKETKHRHKLLRRDIRAIVVALGELKLMVGDERLTKVVKQLHLDHITDEDGLFAACEELAKYRQLVCLVGGKKEGEPIEYYIQPDDELRLTMQKQKLAGPASTATVVAKSEPQVAAKTSNKSNNNKEVQTMSDKDKAAAVVVVEVVDPKWVDFLFAHNKSGRWNVRSLMWLISKGLPFWTMCMIKAIDGRINPSGVIISKSLISSYLYQATAGGYLVTKRRSECKGDGSNATWVSHDPALDDTLSQLMAEFDQIDEDSTPPQTISGPVGEAEDSSVQDVVQDVEALDDALDDELAEHQEEQAEVVQELEVGGEVFEDDPSLPLHDGVRQIQDQVANLFYQQQQAHDEQVCELRLELEAARDATTAANVKLELVQAEVARLQAVLSQVASAIETAKS